VKPIDTGRYAARGWAVLPLRGKLLWTDDGLLVRKDEPDAYERLAQRRRLGQQGGVRAQKKNVSRGGPINACASPEEPSIAED
jgi:hypothetical protein